MSRCFRQACVVIKPQGRDDSLRWPMTSPPHLLKTRRRKVLVLSGVVLCVAAAGGLMYVRGSTAAPQYRTAAASLGTIRQTLSLTGNLTPVAQSNLNFQVSGTVTAIDVSAGQTVTAGQVLATIDGSSLQTALTQAQANLTAAQAKLTADQSSSSTSSSTVAQQVATARTTLANDQTAYNDTIAVNAQTMTNDQQAVSAAQAAVNSDNQSVAHAQQTYNTDGCNSTSSATCQTDQQNLATAQQQQSKDQQSLSTAQTAVPTDTVRAQQSADQAAAKVASDRTALSSAVSGSGTTSTASQASAIAQDDAGLSQAQQAVTTAQTAVSEATLTAPTDGQVAQINLAVGSTTSSPSSAASASSTASTTQFILLTPGSFQVTSTVSDSEISQVAVGQHAVVTAAGSTNGLPATVTSVGVIATVSSGVATFPVTVQITGGHPSLRDGMSAAVVVVINQVVGVLTVPTSAVHTNGTTSTVNVLKGGSPSAVTVTVGSADSSRTQITSGLAAGDTVVIATVTSTLPSTSSTTTRRGSGLAGGGGAGIVTGGPPPGG
jgi:HlyD family secretion protein